MNEYERIRGVQAALARLAAQQLETVNHALDTLEGTKLPRFEGTAADFRRIDREVGIEEAFNQLNHQLRRLNERRGRHGIA